MNLWNYEHEILMLLTAIGVNALLHIRSTIIQPNERLDRCASCRYDLAGLAHDAACPECAGSERLQPRRRRVVSFDYWGAALTGALMAVTVITVNIAKPLVWFGFYRWAGYDRVVFSLTHGVCRLDGGAISVRWAFFMLCFLPLFSRFRRRISMPVSMLASIGIIGFILVMTYAQLQASWAAGYVRW